LRLEAMGTVAGDRNRCPQLAQRLHTRQRPLKIEIIEMANIKVWDVNAEGTLSNGRIFFEGVGSGALEEGAPDGMKCDETGVWVISAAGNYLGTIRVPENVGNLTWAAPTGTRSTSRRRPRCTQSPHWSAPVASRICANSSSTQDSRRPRRSRRSSRRKRLVCLR
jgi:sugar lactone lactonase YvrE